MNYTPSQDSAVSPVISVILMVAITVVLAATVYVWVGNLGSTPTATEQASATARGLDTDSNGRTDWIRVTLTYADTAYPGHQTNLTTLAPDGTVHETTCRSARIDGTTCNDPFEDGHHWQVGATLYLPCYGPGDHAITAAVRGTAILDTSTTCGEQAGG